MPALGFLEAGRVVVLAFVLLPILGFLVRRRWRLAAARRVAVMRLARLATEEAARAEEEAVMLFRGFTFVPADAVPAAGGESRPRELPPNCAVCLVPTTTRCARCKAVKYCSRNCQIIHWRQGHKDVCHPLQIYDQGDGEASMSKLGVAAAEESDLSFKVQDGDREPQKETLITYSKSLSSKSSQLSEAFSDDESVNTSGTDTTDSSDSSSSSCLAFSGSAEKLDSFSLGDQHSLPCSAKVADHSSDKSNNEFSVLVHDSEMDLKETEFSQFDGMTLSKNNASCTIKFEHNASKEIECNNGDCLSSETMNSRKFSNDEASEYSQNATSAKTGSNPSRDEKIANTSDAYFSKKDNYYNSSSTSHTVASKLPDEVLCQATSTKEKFSSGFSLPRGKLRSYQTSLAAPVDSSGPPKGQFQPNNLTSPGSASADKASACDGCIIPGDASTKVDHMLKVPPKSYQRPGSDTNGVKQSIQRVVQQLKFSKLSKQYTSGLGNDSSTKFKMLFPYDHFVKLYNSDKMELRPSGLINCGNSCYANAVLQCLAFTPPLTAYLLQGLHSRSCPKKDWCFTCKLEDMLLKVKQGHSPLSPTGVLSHLHRIGSHLGHGREEDAHEFLRYAIDMMQSVCLNEAGGSRGDHWAEETTLVQLTFGGYLQSKIQCTKCHCKSERNDRMMDLTVEIHGDIGTLEEALKRFTSTEILDGENKYNCSRCRTYERAKKKLTVLDAPNILTIALKRFQSGKFGKLNKAIRFPEHLDLAPYMSGSVDKSPLYRLYAVVVHLDVMNSAFSGHYICYVRSAQGKWYKTDDILVKPVELSSVLSKNAYMLFYSRCLPRSPNLTRGITFQDQVICRKSRHKLSDGEEAGLNASSHNLSDQTNRDQSNSRTGFVFSNESSDLMDRRFIFTRTDSASDSSSLFSCSDEASCSTDSTRNSTSTEDLSEYIFGELDRYCWNSSMRSTDAKNLVRSLRSQ